MARLSPPRVRMPRMTRPGRGSRADAEEPTVTEPTPAAADATPAAKEPTPAAIKKEGAPAATDGEQTKGAEAKQAERARETKTAPVTADGAKGPDPNLQERIEGLQGWMAELERKQARMTYFGAVAVVIALAAAGVALYLGITNKNDSATKQDVDALKSRVDSLQTAVTKSSKNTQDTINSSIAQLQSSIQAVQKQQSQDAANISTLQSQAQSGAFSNKAGTAASGAPGAAGAAGAPGATGTAQAPGATTNTPNKH